jgi:integrase
MARKAARRDFGYVRQLPSGRWQASYLAPDGKRYTARTDDDRPLTFDSRTYASAWLSRVHGDIQAGRWVSPDAPKAATALVLLLRAYADAWLEGRELSATTGKHYRDLLDRLILPALGDTEISSISPVVVREWHAGLPPKPTQKAHAYSLLRTIANTAVDDGIIASNPCRVRGAGQAKRARQIRAATLPELETIAAAVPERYKLMILLAAWCAMRFGELAELRRSDVDVKNLVIHIRRGVIRGDAGTEVKGPKSEAGRRDVNIPPHLKAAVVSHLQGHVQPRGDALVFPAASGRHMSPSSLQAVYYPARKKAGREDLRFHDLRHTGAVLAAATGATLAELMARLGHSTVSAAMRYQHAAQDRDKAIAEALSKLAEVKPITAAKGRKRKGA